MPDFRIASWPARLVWLGLAVVGVAALGGLASVGFRVGNLADLLPPGQTPLAVAISSVVALVGVLMFLTGLVAWVLYYSASAERARCGYGTLWTIVGLFLVANIIGTVLSIPPLLLSQPLRAPGQNPVLSPGSLVISVLAVDGPLIGLLYLRIVRFRVLTWAELGFSLDKVWDRVGLGVLVGALAFGLAAVAALALQKVGIESTQLELFTGLRNAPVAQFFGVFLAVAVIAPVCEEAFFRGYIVTVIARARGAPVAIVASSFLFSLSHAILTIFLPILLVGILFAIVFRRTGSVVSTIVAHAILNGVTLVSIYLLPP